MALATSNGFTGSARSLNTAFNKYFMLPANRIAAAIGELRMDCEVCITSFNCEIDGMVNIKKDLRMKKLV
jgi:hypothetical protein